MDCNIENILEKIEKFIPEDDNWFELEDILEQLFCSKNHKVGLDAMIGIYEKYPDEDNDILWGMLHGIENIDNYEIKIIESVKRKPSFFCVLMINRILNGGINSIGDIKLVDILRAVLDNPYVSDTVREQTLSFINRHLE